jgi:hypothetical protein
MSKKKDFATRTLKDCLPNLPLETGKAKKKIKVLLSRQFCASPKVNRREVCECGGWVLCDFIPSFAILAHLSSAPSYIRMQLSREAWERKNISIHYYLMITKLHEAPRKLTNFSKKELKPFRGHGWLYPYNPRDYPDNRSKEKRPPHSGRASPRYITSS